MKQPCLTNTQEHENGYSFTRQLVNSSLSGEKVSNRLPLRNLIPASISMP
jgi:hypothetical protein